MIPLHIVVPGTPATWKRAVPHKGRMLTSKRMRAAKERIAVRAVLAARAAGWDLIADGAIAVDIIAHRRRIATATPDGDNIGKCVLDALNGNVWKDDAQVVDLRVRKVDARDGDGVERTEIWVRPA